MTFRIKQNNQAFPPFVNDCFNSETRRAVVFPAAAAEFSATWILNVQWTGTHTHTHKGLVESPQGFVDKSVTAEFLMNKKAEMDDKKQTKNRGRIGKKGKASMSLRWDGLSSAGPEALSIPEISPWTVCDRGWGAGSAPQHTPEQISLVTKHYPLHLLGKRLLHWDNQAQLPRGKSHFNFVYAIFKINLSCRMRHWNKKWSEDRFLFIQETAVTNSIPSKRSDFKGIIVSTKTKH